MYVRCINKLISNEKIYFLMQTYHHHLKTLTCTMLCKPHAKLNGRHPLTMEARQSLIMLLSAWISVLKAHGTTVEKSRRTSQSSPSTISPVKRSTSSASGLSTRLGHQSLESLLRTSLPRILGVSCFQIVSRSPQLEEQKKETV